MCMLLVSKHIPTNERMKLMKLLKLFSLICRFVVIIKYTFSCHLLSAVQKFVRGHIINAEEQETKLPVRNAATHEVCLLWNQETNYTDATLGSL